MFMDFLILILLILIGIFAGTISGLIPGIHVNMVGLGMYLLISNYNLEDMFSPLALSVFLLSAAITHTFVDFIPSIYLGAPEEGTALSVSIGHQYFNKGLGRKAVILTIYGGLIGTIILLFVSPLVFIIIPKIYPLIKSLIPYLLIFFLIYLVIRQEKRKLSIAIIISTGVLGLMVLNAPINKMYYLFPLLSGLFGVSTLILSLENKGKRIKEKNFKLKKEDYYKGSFLGVVGGILAALVPGLGATASGMLVTNITKTIKKDIFITTIGTINTIDAFLSIIAIYLIGNARSGTAVIIDNIITITTKEIVIMASVALVVAAISSILTLKILKIYSQITTKYSHKRTSIFVLVFILIMTIILTNYIGVLILVTSTAIGIYTQTKKINKTILGSVLVIPTILFYLL